MSETLDSGWILTRSAPSQWTLPRDIEATDWLPAIVPGTLGSALMAAGRWQPDDAVGFDDGDCWYKTSISGTGPVILRFDGLATITDVFLDDTLVLHSETMFLSHEVAVDLQGTHALHLCFRALDPFLATKRGRARWRPRLVQPPSLRFVRTILRGHIPGWTPPVHAVGPWRDITRIDPAALRILEHRIKAHFEDDGAGASTGDGVLELAVRFSAPTTGWVVATVGTIDFTLVAEADDGWLRGQITLPAVEPWWPHTHGTPAQYPLSLLADGHSFALGNVGFRHVAIDRDRDGEGFGLVVNGVPVFCRGACWSGADLVALPFSREAYAPLLGLMVAAGMNMVRLCAPMGYEGPAFHALCDELGLMVWQDFAFSNFDYPASDAVFTASVQAEARQVLQRLQGSPSLTILCGASEVAQQAAMLGLPAAVWTNTIFEDLLPAVAAALRPDVIYVPHSPCGGALPFVADSGISHYYGVSAHRRPLEEARRAGVRFAAESLGFANVPDKAPFILEADRPCIVHPDFTERFVHDTAASWAFEGVRNHYCALLYDVDVAALREADPDRFLALSRATSAEVMETCFAEWRRHGSPTRGALVWFLRDLVPGAGWGVIDVLDEPKAAYWGLQRAFRPVTIVLSDENLNGLTISLINETARERNVTLTLACLRDGATPVMSAARDLVLAPRSTIGLPATDLWGAFFDTTYAFRFGEPSHDVTIARLADRATGAPIAEAFHFPLGRGHARHDLGLTATIAPERDGRWALTLRTARLAQSIRIEAGPARPPENWFHLAPDTERIVLLETVGGAKPQGWVEAINGCGRVAF